jgi:hypothetical protein
MSNKVQLKIDSTDHQISIHNKEIEIYKSHLEALKYNFDEISYIKYKNNYTLSKHINHKLKNNKQQ